MGFLWQRTALVALDFESGEDVWRHESGWWATTVCTPQYKDGRLYVVRHSDAEQLQCLDAASGEAIWSAELGENWTAVEPLWVDGLVIVTTSTGRLAAFEAHSGEFAWEWTAPGGRIGVVPYRRGQRGHVGGPALFGAKSGDRRSGRLPHPPRSGTRT